MTSFLLVVFLLGQCFFFLHVKFRMKKLFFLKRIINNKLVSKHSDWPVVKNEGNSTCMSFRSDIVLVWFSFLLLFFSSSFFGPWFLPFFLYFGRKIISVWGHLVVFPFLSHDSKSFRRLLMNCHLKDYRIICTVSCYKWEG